jgi:predicted 3-demethylubiquinone-9 3-methyltransferase (glyoxalase superfamily)
MSGGPKVSTCLWFDRDGEDAAKLYTSLIPGSAITHVSRYGEGSAMPAGTAMMVVFNLAGTPYMALNGGPMFTKSEACSIVVTCDTQQEIDHLWSSLTANGGHESRCFWLKDRYGLSWQIVPGKLGEWMTSPDKAAASRVFAVMMAAVKPDIAALEAAFKGA